jgi:two-component system, OmpR family, sensor histidine kinase SenX3
MIASLVTLVAGMSIGFAVARRRFVGASTASAEQNAQIERTIGRRQVAGDRLASLVLEALGHGVVIVDRDERVVVVNPSARAMGVLVADRLAFVELTTVVRTATDTRRRVERSLDLPLGRLGREPIALALTAVPLFDADDKGRVTAVALLLDDVTEGRRLDAVRRDFVANVSHELKTPVGALLLLAEAVTEAADDPDAVQRFAGRMQHEGARLGRLVRELIELSRLQGAEPLPGDDIVPVARIIDEAVDRTRLAAETLGVTIRVRCSGDLAVAGNESQLTMAIANLIDNAVVYSSSGTRVSVSARPVRGEDDRAHVEIAVSDQGIGIAEPELSRVFERFYRVDPARSRATGGTGLGLAIVKHVATNHGGSVSVWSVEGAGSTFTVRLPLVHPTEASSAVHARYGAKKQRTMAKGST